MTTTNNVDFLRIARAIGCTEELDALHISIARRRADPCDPDRAVGIDIGASRTPG
jgi:hypothetical protein